MTYKMKQEAHKMFRWVINTIFENNQEHSINFGDLRKELEYTWDDMVERGEIVLNENDKV